MTSCRKYKKTDLQFPWQYFVLSDGVEPHPGGVLILHRLPLHKVLLLWPVGEAKS